MNDFRKRSRLSPRSRRAVRVHRTRARLHGTASRPRLSVFRSHRALAVQLVNDDVSKTVVGLTTVHLPKKVEVEKGLSLGVARARALGKLLAERAGALGIQAAVFDRGGYAYHGQVKAVAEGAREGGLKF